MFGKVKKYKNKEDKKIKRKKGYFIIFQHNDDGTEYVTEEFWSKKSQKERSEEGFIPSFGYKTGWRFIFAKQYAKWLNIKKNQEDQIDAQVLGDYCLSNSTNKFISSMRATIGELDTKRLLMFVLLGLVGLGAFYFLFMGGSL
jgi:hypothetical protein